MQHFSDRKKASIISSFSSRRGAIYDASQVKSGAIFDATFGEPEKCCIKNCYIVVSLNKVLIILMLGSLLEVH